MSSRSVAAAAAAAAASLLLSASPVSSSFTLGGALGPRFDGIGAISGGGATSRFLMDYDTATQEAVYDILFEPNFGAALHIFKVEIGGEALSTEGSEPSHSRTPDDLNCERGYEWPLLRAAKARNPDILLYGLPWTWSGWVGDAANRDPYSTNVSNAAAYITSWVGCADAQSTPINVLGIWNERSFSPDYAKALRATLDARGFTNVTIVADDAHYECVGDMIADPTLAAVIGIVGGHGLPPADVGQLGKPVWFSEDFHANGGDAGAGTWAYQTNRRFLANNMTATLAWNTLDSFYEGLSFDRTGLMTANSPWSGAFEVLATIWATAHTTQATQPGFFYLSSSSSDGGSGYLLQGGSYVGYVDPPSKSFSLVIEKSTQTGDENVQPESATFCVSPALRALAPQAFTGPLYVVRSQWAIAPGEVADYFAAQPTITPDANGCFSLSVGVDTQVTVTTLATMRKGVSPVSPPTAPFPFPYADDFSSCVPPRPGRYVADISGTWECVTEAGGNIAIQLKTPAKPISWENDFRPHSVLGDRNWRDVNFTSSFQLSAAGDVYIAGVRCTLNNATNYAALMLEISFPGLWLALNSTGGWSLWSTIQAATNYSTTPLAQGSLPGGRTLAPGTWHTTTLVASLGQFSAWVDGAAIATALDVSSLPWTGWVGIGTKDYGEFVLVDNISVTAPE
jgi:galactosylceramidase